MNVLINLILSGIAIVIAAYITPGARVDGYITAIIVAVVLAIVNSTLGFFLKVVTFPLNIITLGLISLVINVLMVLLVTRIVPGFQLDGFFTALIFAVILSLINMVFGGNLIK